MVDLNGRLQLDFILPRLKNSATLGEVDRATTARDRATQGIAGVPNIVHYNQIIKQMQQFN